MSKKPNKPVKPTVILQSKSGGVIVPLILFKVDMSKGSSFFNQADASESFILCINIVSILSIGILFIIIPLVLFKMIVELLNPLIPGDDPGIRDSRLRITEKLLIQQQINFRIQEREKAGLIPKKNLGDWRDNNHYLGFPPGHPAHFNPQDEERIIQLLKRCPGYLIEYDIDDRYPQIWVQGGYIATADDSLISKIYYQEYIATKFGW